ncbi:hypothetical protein ALC62_11077 [Cyphomyrmex costatus]|uniref:Uncharacterized protein n=1 Tax=Cyphomyrmex costatus TaxID=456900 RepID=A0A151ICX5_9HYME|nr:hypothetical protein ALC62_11077 [Cyphomyrmex costatus]
MKTERWKGRGRSRLTAAAAVGSPSFGYRCVVVVNNIRRRERDGARRRRKTPREREWRKRPCERENDGSTTTDTGDFDGRLAVLKIQIFREAKKQVEVVEEEEEEEKEEEIEAPAARGESACGPDRKRPEVAVGTGGERSANPAPPPLASGGLGLAATQPQGRC